MNTPKFFGSHFARFASLETSGSALESRDDCAFNALGLVQKLALSVKCEANAQPLAKKLNAYFDFFVSYDLS